MKLIKITANPCQLTTLRSPLLVIFFACLSIRLVHAQKSEPLYFEHKTEIVSAQYDENDNLLITASVDGIVKLWDPATGKLIRPFGSVTRPSKTFSAELSPDGKLIATINGRGGKVWNTKFGDLVCILSGYSDTIKSIHFSSNSKWLVAGSLDGTAKLWDIHTGKRHHSLNHMFESLGKKELQSGVTDARFCDNDKAIITGSGKAIRDSMHQAVDSSLSVNGNKRYVAEYDSNTLVWELKTGKVLDTLAGYPFDVSPDGARIITGSVNTARQDARVWDAVTGKLMLALSGHAGKVTTCQFSKNGKLILTASIEDGTCRVWDALTGKSICSLNAGPEHANNTAQVSPDGKWISTYSQDTTKIWETSTGKLQHAIPAGKLVTFSNDSRHMVILTGKRGSIYDTVSGQPVIVEKKADIAGNKKVVKVR